MKSLTDNIWVVGDCHAHMFFTVIPLERIIRLAGCRLHWVLGEFPVHMFDHPDGWINRPKDGGYAVIYMFGEVDARWSIIRQIEEKGRALEEVVQDLAKRYVEVVLRHKEEYNIRPIISCVIPPSDVGPEVGQQLGTRAERVLSTKSLNAAVKGECDSQNVLFLDFYDHYALEDGSVNHEFTDTQRHICWSDHIENELDKILKSNKDGWHDR